MSREVRRVPANFDWPLNEVWAGYCPPSPRPCPAGDDCAHGYTRAGWALQHMVGGILMLAEDRSSQERGRPLHPWLAQGLLYDGIRPSADIVQLTTGLAGREPSMLGHDSIDRHQATKAVIQAAGLDPEAWGICPSCQGHGIHPGDVEDEDAPSKWVEPPTGEAYQMWETTSEGSPISPPMPTPEALADWLAENGASVFGKDTASREQWLGIILGSGYTVGLIGDQNGLRPGFVDAPHS